MKKYIITAGAVYPAEVCPCRDGWRSKGPAAITYPARRVKDWDELTHEQKRWALADTRNERLGSVDFAIAKDPSLKDLRTVWITNIEREYAEHLEQLTEWI